VWALAVGRSEGKLVNFSTKFLGLAKKACFIFRLKQKAEAVFVAICPEKPFMKMRQLVNFHTKIFLCIIFQKV
jgi:hypothetical protein